MERLHLVHDMLRYKEPRVQQSYQWLEIFIINTEIAQALAPCGKQLVLEPR